jgi:hypothetical protein
MSFGVTILVGTWCPGKAEGWGVRALLLRP